MKKILSMIACLLVIACGTTTTTKSIKINGDFSQYEKIAADSKVELLIVGEEEALATTTLEENK